MSPEALWSGNFRELAASVTRMATLANKGRITVAGVEEEILRLRCSWQRAQAYPLAPWLGDTGGGGKNSTCLINPN